MKPFTWLEWNQWKPWNSSELMKALIGILLWWSAFEMVRVIEKTFEWLSTKKGIDKASSQFKKRESEASSLIDEIWRIFSRLCRAKLPRKRSSAKFSVSKQFDDFRRSLVMAIIRDDWKGFVILVSILCSPICRRFSYQRQTEYFIVLCRFGAIIASCLQHAFSDQQASSVTCWEQLSQLIKSIFNWSKDVDCPWRLERRTFRRNSILKLSFLKFHSHFQSRLSHRDDDKAHELRCLLRNF